MVTHDARIAAVADRVIAMRDGAFADDTQLATAHHGAAHPEAVHHRAGTVYDGRH
jgi:putative ABC transport system ATP-binding protein